MLNPVDSQIIAFTFCYMPYPCQCSCYLWLLASPALAARTKYSLKLNNLHWKQLLVFIGRLILGAVTWTFCCINAAVCAVSWILLLWCTVCTVDKQNVMSLCLWTADSCAMLLLQFLDIFVFAHTIEEKLSSQESRERECGRNFF